MHNKKSSKESQNVLLSLVLCKEPIINDQPYTLSISIFQITFLTLLKTRVSISHSSVLRVQMYNSFLNLQYFLKK